MHWGTFKQVNYSKMIGDVGSALPPPYPTIRVLSYSNCQRSTHSIFKYIFWNLALYGLICYTSGISVMVLVYHFIVTAITHHKHNAYMKLLIDLPNYLIELDSGQILCIITRLVHILVTSLAERLIICAIHCTEVDQHTFDSNNPNQILTTSSCLVSISIQWNFNITQVRPLFAPSL